MANSYAASVGGSGGEPSVTASAIVAHAVGSHILRVDGYSHPKDLGNGKCITSEKFVVGGHRWYLEYYPDGAGLSSSDWISIFLRLDYSHYSNVEIKAKFTISLLDHDGNMVSSYSRPCSLCIFSGSGSRGSNAAWGFNEFIKRTDLEGSAYLKKDAFSVRCDVSVAAKEFSAKAIPVPAVHRGV